MPSVPFRNGDVVDGVEFFFPLEEWAHDEVLAFLRDAGAPVHSCYDDGFHGVDCMRCTAWWNEGHFKYLKKHHPVTFNEVVENVCNIAEAINGHLVDLRALSDIAEG
jgi:3'-phosphoadenosine 5'-phosphosulfate sulfotransferase (PAPS reductase)/FAD synthetase